MLISDIISQLPGSENVLPVNAITSLIGISCGYLGYIEKQKILRSHTDEHKP